MTSSTRRTTAEVRELVLGAAQQLFREQGYAATTTKQIANTAGVAETVVFDRFGTKPELFEVATIEPFRAFIGDYIASWRSIPRGGDIEKLIKTFIDGFIRLLSQNRRMLQDCTAASMSGDNSAMARLSRLVQQDFARALTQMSEVLEGEDAALHFGGLDPPLSVAAGLGMAMSLVLLDDWLIDPDHRRPGRERILRELTAMILHGLTHRPSS
ncbi:TetR/AcrR family transcriptional regulator [Mycolicibacterium hodleri]|uniref:TetR/AcrR family transcriptional regulator n=1 Tax=Mycolicibacterium hodleri TaxID=49897 RepID=A0A502E513_9MYCO|nr:TetR/AcrR family transcriptional regulator [Mycolicibacterium hodleri]TPG32434.1 TetR/AcrR family transcriptional regulator [Mycolicibacterium hodleri]